MGWAFSCQLVAIHCTLIPSALSCLNYFWCNTCGPDNAANTFAGVNRRSRVGLWGPCWPRDCICAKNASVSYMHMYERHAYVCIQIVYWNMHYFCRTEATLYSITITNYVLKGPIVLFSSWWLPIVDVPIKEANLWMVSVTGKIDRILFVCRPEHIRCIFYVGHIWQCR